MRTLQWWRVCVAIICLLACFKLQCKAERLPATTKSLLSTPSSSISWLQTLPRDLRVSIAGGLAGAVATVLLHPLDTAKTLRQANPHRFAGTRAAMAHLLQTHGPMSMFAGVGPAIIGSIPSSALYFGGYEVSKRRLTEFCIKKGWSTTDASGSLVLEPKMRAPVHMLSAAVGNVASSVVFVPKEFVKQSMQAAQEGMTHSALTMGTVLRTTLQTQGVKGLYKGYSATLSRNIPSACLRFSIYEEMKLLLARQGAAIGGLGSGSLVLGPKLLLAGAVAGALASGITTPFDAIKTKVATGRLDGTLSILGDVREVIREDGFMGLYAGAQPRMVMAACFSAIGFGSFELFKGLLQVEKD